MKEATRKAVQELAKQLEYQPNLVAQGLKMKHSKLIGVMIPEASNPFFANAISGILNIANQNGYNILSVQSSESLEVEKKNIELLINAQVDGIIASVSIETSSAAHFQKLVDRDIPLVFFDRIIESLEVPMVVIDNYEILCKTTQHLIDIGCKRIAKIAAPVNSFNSRWRLKGYEDTLTTNNIPIDRDLIVFDTFGAAKSEILTHQLMNLPSPPDAIIANNDVSAMKVMHTLKSLKVSIPKEVCVVGFNNDKFSAFLEPSLSSIEAPAYTMGESATQVLFDMIHEEQRIPLKIVLPSKLIIRNSLKRFEE